MQYCITCGAHLDTAFRCHKCANTPSAPTAKPGRIKRGDIVKSKVRLQSQEAVFNPGTIFVVDKRYNGLQLTERDPRPRTGSRLTISKVPDTSLIKIS